MAGSVQHPKSLVRRRPAGARVRVPVAPEAGARGATRTRPQPSSLEREFAFYWCEIFRGPPLEAEYRFAAPRRWRWDFCHVASRVAIELDGGTWVRGRHSRGSGQSADAEKANEAQLAGWLVIRLTADMLRREPLRWMRAINDAITRRMPP